MGRFVAFILLALFGAAPFAVLVHTIMPSVSAKAVLGGGAVLCVLLVAADRSEPTNSRIHRLTPDELDRRLTAATPPETDWLERTAQDVFGRSATEVNGRHSTPHNTPPAIYTSAGTRRPIDEDVRWQVWKRDGMRCRRCGAESRLTIDHITPVSLGGTNDENNLQTLCRSCNSRKGARAI